MPALRELQAQMRDYLLQEAAAPELLAQVQESGIMARQRLQIYRNNIRSTLAEGLAAVYPVVQALVGPDCFRQCSQRFSAFQPPASGDLNAVGEGFAAFLQAEPSLAGLAYLPDMARLEWALHTAYYAEPQPILTAAHLQAMGEADPERLHFRLHPAVTLLALSFAVEGIWQAHQQAEMPNLQLATGPIFLMVSNPDGTPQFARLTKAEYEWLHALGRGMSLSAAFDRVDGAEEAAAEWLLKHLQLGSFRAEHKKG